LHAAAQGKEQAKEGVLRAKVDTSSSIRRLTKPLRNLVVRTRHSSLTGDDVLLASYPRSGNTWLAFLLYESLTGAPATFSATFERIPGAGRHRGAPALIGRKGRLIRTHESFRDGAGRAIYLVRDPRSVVLSLYSFSLRQGKYSGPFDDFFDDFVKGRVQPFGAWEGHVRYWLGREADPGAEGVYLVRYEDLRSEPEKLLDGLLRWLGEDVDQDLIKNAVVNNTVDRMRIKEDQEASGTHFSGAANRRFRFVNVGSTTEWRNRLSPDQLATVEEGQMGLVLRRLGYPVSIRT
jgi:hypothetical protein